MGALSSTLGLWHGCQLPPAWPLGVGASQGCCVQGSRCVQMCYWFRVLRETAILPVLPRAWGAGKNPCPRLCQGENGLPGFTEAAVQGAADVLGNLLQFFLPGPALPHSRCFLGLPRELRARLVGRAEPPGPLSSLEVGRITPIPPLTLTGGSRIHSAKNKHENTNPRGSKGVMAETPGVPGRI